MTRQADLRRVILAGWLALTAACSVPGDYNVTALKKVPAAALTYPDSNDVVRTQTNGTTKNFLRRGNPAAVTLRATSAASPAHVVAYYSKALVDDGWSQTSDDPYNTDVPGRTMHVIGWSRPKIGFGLYVWTDPTTKVTFYETTLAGSI